MKNLLLILVSILFTTNIIASNLDMIKSVSVQTDYEYHGVKGINITYKYNFLPLIQENKNDTLLDNAIFKISTKLYQNNVAIEPAKGYQSQANTNDKLEFTLSLLSTDISPTKTDKTITQFIPYAVLKLNEGNQDIDIKAEITGKDAVDFFHHQKVEKNAITFNKPKTKTFTLNIDYIEVNTMNAQGQAWDYSIFRTDAPDIQVLVLVGNISVWKKSVTDTYMFAVGPYSKNISFIISENDKVEIYIQDIDLIFHDYIANWNFTTSDKKPGTLYTYNKAKGNIKSCNVNFRID